MRIYRFSHIHMDHIYKDASGDVQDIIEQTLRLNGFNEHLPIHRWDEHDTHAVGFSQPTFREFLPKTWEAIHVEADQ